MEVISSLDRFKRKLNFLIGKYFESTPNRKIKGRFDTLIKERVFRESIPDWIDKIGVKELGLKKWKKELSALNKQAQVINKNKHFKN